mgnify:CR=1 FL=1
MILKDWWLVAANRRRCTWQNSIRLWNDHQSRGNEILPQLTAQNQPLAETGLTNPKYHASCKNYEANQNI